MKGISKAGYGVSFSRCTFIGEKVVIHFVFESKLIEANDVNHVLHCKQSSNVG